MKTYEIIHNREKEQYKQLFSKEAIDHIGASRVRSGIFLAPSAALDPACLVRGLAGVVEQAGVRIVEELRGPTRPAAGGPGRP